MFKLLSSASLALALLAPVANAGTTSFGWSGATVSITSPDAVLYDTAFDLSFAVDASTMSSFDAIAFRSALTISDSVDLSGATWGYHFASDLPAWNFDRSGLLGDSFTELAASGGGYQVAFTDPIAGPFAWLWRDFNESVTWTLRNLVIERDATFSLRLDDDDILDGPIERGVTVLALASATPIPEPSPYVLVMCGLLAWSSLAAVRRRQSHNS